MRKLLFSLAAWVSVAVVLALPLIMLPGAVDMFLKLEGIPGESQDSKHKDEIDILAWSWGVSNSGTTHLGSGSGVGKSSFQDISITKYVDKATPVLMYNAASGRYITKGTLTMRSVGKTPVEFLIIELEDILVTSLSTGGSGGEDRLTENVSLNFSKFKLKYSEVDVTGSVISTPTIEWDIAANTGSQQ